MHIFLPVVFIYPSSRSAAMRNLIGATLLAAVVIAGPTVRTAYPSCEAYVGRNCSTGFMKCTTADGASEVLQCYGGSWHYA
jgi:hypothetical protein